MDTETPRTPIIDDQPTLSRLQRGRTTTAKKGLPPSVVQQFIDNEAEEASDSEEEEEGEEMRDFIAPDVEEPSSSSSDSESERKRKHRHHHHKRRRCISTSRSRSPSPVPKAKKPKSKKKESVKTKADTLPKPGPRFSEDSKLVAPLPLVRFLQQRQTRKACGRCEECKKPPCGKCKNCIQNLKHPKPDGSRDRRRCEMLKCKNDKSCPDIVVAPGIPTDKEEISKLLQNVSSQLAEKSALRGSPEFNPEEYEGLVEKMRQLHDALNAIKSRKARQKTQFPLCFHDAFGIVSELEKKRLKFAKFVVRASSGEDCRTMADKREMRDDLDELITLWCTRRAKNLAPIAEVATYKQLLEKKRDS